jgi:hypothetical protein
MPYTENEDPIATKLRIDMEEPSMAKSSTAKAEPKRAQLRRDNDEPSSTTSSTASEEPSRAMPNTAMLLPKLVILRSARVDPK